MMRPATPSIAEFLISARDLAAHDVLPDLADIGIECVKIEGRKNPNTSQSPSMPIAGLSTASPRARPRKRRLPKSAAGADLQSRLHDRHVHGPRRSRLRHARTAR